MTKTTGYTPTPTPLSFELDVKHLEDWMATLDKFGGWNPETRTFSPICLDIDSEDGSLVERALDSIAAAVEAGVLTEDHFPMLAFASENDFDLFRADLIEYGETFWLNDRHFTAFFHGLGVPEEAARHHEALSEFLDGEWK